MTPNTWFPFISTPYFILNIRVSQNKSTPTMLKTKATLYPAHSKRYRMMHSITILSLGRSYTGLLHISHPDIANKKQQH